MANNIFQVKRTNVSGRTPNTTASYGTNSQYIAAGEFALNMADGILYTSNGSAIIEIGANNTNQRITNSLTVNNARNLNFQTVNTSAASYFTQQNDDNFVFYSTNTAYGARPVWGVFANSITSNLQIYIPLQLNSGVVANNSLGVAGQVLTTNGSATYWSSVGGTGTVTSVGSANGISGGPITGTGTLFAVAGNSTIFVNASGIHVNTASIPSGAVNVDAQYVWTNTQTFTNTITFNSTINGTANNTAFVGSVSAANVVSNAQLSANLANYQTTAGLAANVATLTSNNATNFNGQPASFYTNASNITTGTLPWAQAPTGTVNTSGNFTLSGNTTLAGTNTTISSNLNVTGSFLNVASAFVVNSTGGYHTGTINAASHTVGTSTIANSIGVYTGIVNATTHSSGATFTANSTLVNAAAINVTGQVNTATFFATTSANVGTAVVANSIGVTTTGFVNSATVVNSAAHTIGTTLVANTLGVYHTGTVNAAVLSTGTTFIANATQITFTLPLSSNGSTGVAGQVLTSNGATGSPYWASAAGGGYYKGGSSTVGTLAGGGQNIFRVNANTLNNNTTISAGENAQATGPLAVASGITLTVQTGARVSIV